MQLPVVLTCTSLSIIVVFDTIIISAALLRKRRRVGGLAYYDYLLFFLLYVFAWTPASGTIWLGVHPADINRSVPVTMCFLSIMTVHCALTIGLWSLFQGHSLDKLFRGAAMLDFFAVLILDAIGLSRTLKLDYSSALICYSLGNALCFLYMWSVYPVLASWNIFSRPKPDHGGVPWAWYFSGTSIPVLVIVPVFLRDGWVLPGTLFITSYLLLPWAVIPRLYGIFFKSKLKANSSGANLSDSSRYTPSSESARKLVEDITVPPKTINTPKVREYQQLQASYPGFDLYLSKTLVDLEAEEVEIVKSLGTATGEWFITLNQIQTTDPSQSDKLWRTQLTDLRKAVTAPAAALSTIRTQKNQLVSDFILGDSKRVLVKKLEQLGCACYTASTQNAVCHLSYIKAAIEEVQSACLNLAVPKTKGI